MVGGYIIFDDKPFIIGENDLVSRFGNYESAVSRVTVVGMAQKPVLASIKYDLIEVPVAVWLSCVGNALTLKGSGITGVISITPSAVTVTFSKEE